MYYYINSFHKYLYNYKMPRKSILDFFVKKEENIENTYALDFKVERPNMRNKKIENEIPPEIENSFLKQFGIKVKKMNNINENTSNYPIRKILIYTDGSCLGNGHKDARGGIGIYFPNSEYPNVSERFTNKPTNQRCELTAIYKSFLICHDDLLHDSKIVLYTDSEYSIKCLKEYCKKWSLNGWVKSDKSPVENIDIIEPLYSLYSKFWRNIQIEHVRAHTGNNDIHSKNNDFVDNLAKKGATS
jgi:ribonuclease HI